jgi:hypothetical protein
MMQEGINKLAPKGNKDNKDLDTLKEYTNEIRLSVALGFFHAVLQTVGYGETSGITVCHIVV